MKIIPCNKFVFYHYNEFTKVFGEPIEVSLKQLAGLRNKSLMFYENGIIENPDTADSCGIINLRKLKFTNLILGISVS